jgi:hypothetical protein
MKTYSYSYCWWCFGLWILRVTTTNRRFIIMSAGGQQQSSSSAAQRKAAFRQLVLTNYGQPITLGSCGVLTGPAANDVIPATTCDGDDTVGNRDLTGTNFVLGRNGGIAVLAYENPNQPVPSFPLEVIKCAALTDTFRTSSSTDFDLALLLRTWLLLDRNLAQAQELEDYIQERYDNGYLRLWLTADEPRNL